MVSIELLGNLLPYGIGGNFILLVIGLCSVVGIGVFFERWIYLKKADADTNALILSLRDQIEKGNMIEALKVCETTGGSIAAILKAGLMKASRGKETMENAMEIAGMMEIASLERNAKILSVIAHIAPLIGLLGTVVGFIQAFSEMKTSGLVDISANQIGEAMEYALVTTAAGLAVAIPTVIGYNYLVSRVEGFVLEMQTTSSEIIDIMMHQDAF
ncbi:MAG: MotA/TolQ/ExbB proton channel family protein [Parachlamydiaceae bacterium]